jgi:glycosyltransferase involved in cell wall biosynthesis
VLAEGVNLVIRNSNSRYRVPAPDDLVDVAVVVPVYNEVDNIEPLHDELSTALDALGRSYMIIYVNDGSRDGTKRKLEQIASTNPNVMTIDFRRNFGQTAAITAGIDYARANIVVLIDADLQNDPNDIGKLISKLETEELDAISGWRKNRQDPFLNRRLPSMMANSLISWVTGVHLHDYGCTLKAYRREVLDEVKLYGEMHRFIPVFAAAAGAQIGEIEVHHRPRIHGKSKYGIWRTFKVILDLITVSFILNYRTTPMYLFGGFGVSLVAASLIPAGVAVYRKIVLNASFTRSPLPLLALTLVILGIQSILMGLLAELLVRTYHESQGKPIYVVQRITESTPGVDALEREPQV